MLSKIAAKYMPKEGRKEHFINEMIKYLTP